MGRFTQLLHRLGRRNERGVTLVEYALIVAVIALPVAGATQFLGDTASDHFESQANGVARPIRERIPVTPSTTTIPPTTTAPTTTAPPATSTTSVPVVVAPTTTIRPTTTTTSTTTSTTTTTTLRATTMRAQFTSPTTSTSGGNWTAATSVGVVNNLGAPVANATVSIRIRVLQRDRGNETWQESTVSGATGSGGVANVSSGSLRRSGNPRDTQVQFVLVGVSSPGLTWDGTGGTVSASAP